MIGQLQGPVVLTPAERPAVSTDVMMGGPCTGMVAAAKWKIPASAKDL
jgi:hypothetical protein